MIWLIDNALRDAHGHYLNYALAIAREAQNRGIGFRALACRDADAGILASLPAEPVFRYGFHHPFPLLALRSDPRVALGWDYWTANRVYQRDLEHSLRGRLSPGDKLFAPTVDHRQLLAWARLTRRLDPALRLTIVLLMRGSFRSLDTPEIDPLRKPLRHSLAALERSRNAGRHTVRLATDSALLAAEYARYTQMPFEVFPIPHTLPNSASKRSGGDAVTVCFLGDARAEKGFDVLADAVRILREFVPAHGLRLRLQCPVTHAAHESMTPIAARLAALRMPELELIDRVLNEAEYFDLLETSDLVVLPYRRAVYFARTSGPTAEAICAGKPLIVTDGTWLSDQVERHGAGLIVPDGDAVALAKALLTAASEISALSAQARDRAASYRAFHNTKVFVDRLIDAPIHNPEAVAI